MRLTVEDTADGVLLRPARAFPPTSSEQVFGCLRYRGRPKTLKECKTAQRPKCGSAMLVVDTDIVVRHLTNDDRAQAARTRRLIEQRDVLLPITVLLESEWALRSVYGFATAEVIRALRGFVGLPRVTVESADAAATALDWAEQGRDLADALHLAQRAGTSAW
jgi:predicted nucleic-acid-binding protein